MWQENAVFEKEYRKIEFRIGSDIQGAVADLLNYKNAGILACGDFNGFTLYSDTVTLDGAYKLIIGKTKQEFDEDMKQMENRIKLQKEEHQKDIQQLIEYWGKRGMEELDEKHWEFWKKIVPIRLKDLYEGMELGCCLKIVSILNAGKPLEEAKEEIDSQGHSGTSFHLVCAMVKEFCDRGNEFVAHVI